MQYETITTTDALTDFFHSLDGAQWIGFDTEFISEHTYRPQLCLVQIAVDDRLAIIDPLAVEDMTPFWSAICQAPVRSVVFSGREELRFCAHSVGKQPHDLFDLQIAAGLVGLEYPASYGALVNRVLGERLSKGETRTDWRRRPLSKRQLEYALMDVVHLRPLYDELHQRLQSKGRLSWMDDEMHAWQDRVESAENRERWRQMKGVSSLSGKSSVVARELWRWRDEQASQRDIPPKRVLRDDLIVELARRGSSEVGAIRDIRGMERRDLRPHWEELARRIGEAKTMPQDQWPKSKGGRPPAQVDRLSQFFTMALKEISLRAEVAPSIVGTAEDVRDLLAQRMRSGQAKKKPDQLPKLVQGWRAEVVGQMLDDLLAGRVSVAVADPLSESPLVFEPRK